MIDYIFYTDEHLQLKETATLAEQEEYDVEEGLPNSIHPSDHVPLQCKLALLWVMSVETVGLSNRYLSYKPFLSTLSPFLAFIIY